MLRPPPTSTLFPYTTLFRSARRLRPPPQNSLPRPSRPAPLFSSSYSSGCFSQEWWGLARGRSEEHTSELQSLTNLVCRLLLEKKNNKHIKECHDTVTNLISQ